MAANGHRRPATPSHTKPRDTWSDGTSSHVCHHPATPRNRLILKQVHREFVIPACQRSVPVSRNLDLHLPGHGQLWDLGRKSAPEGGHRAPERPAGSTTWASREPHKNPTSPRPGPAPQVPHGQDGIPRHTPVLLVKWGRTYPLNSGNPAQVQGFPCWWVVVRDRIELSTFRFSEGLSLPGPRELSTALAPRCLHKGLSGLTRPC
jgi:hypothetical protein